jgi:hypothetical protein
MVGASLEAQSMLNLLIGTIQDETHSFARTNGAMEFMARAYLLSGVLHQTLDSETSAQHLKRVTEIVSSRPQPWPEARAYQAEALRLLGDAVKAKEILSELDALSFKHSVFLDDLPT